VAAFAVAPARNNPLARKPENEPGVKQLERTVRIGVVGAGGIANFHHLPSLANHPAVRLVAACDVNAPAVAATAAKYHIPNVYTDYRQLVDAGGIDAVVVCTSNDQHSPVSHYAIRNALHVLCEKPLALDAGEAHELALAAERTGVITGVNFSYRCNPAVRYIKDILDSGDLGTIYQVSFQYLQGYLADPETPLRPATAWRVRKSTAGLGVLGDLGSHLIDLGRFWFGEISAIQSLQRTFVRERPLQAGGTVTVDGDDVTMALLDFESGALATLQTSWSAAPWGNHQRVEIYGSKGSIVYENEDQRAIKAVFGSPMFKYRSFASLAVPQAYHDTSTTHPAAFVDAVLAGEPYSPSFADGARCQAVLDAIANAAVAGGRVRVN
jgi:predicted dehydrogenase